MGKNYRGVHLTPQLSKVIERTLGSLFLPRLQAAGAYGPNQYAYSKGRSHKDTLTINVCNWILLLELGYLVGVYCSDVQGAFDRVSAERLSEKLGRLGLHDDVLGFLCSWLEARTSEVVLGGQRSGAALLVDSVFQGTVLGPPLWNVHYADCRLPLRKQGYTETAFADDLNCWKAFPKPRASGNNVQGPLLGHGPLLSDLRSVQHELHLWGAANQVLFDPAKESFHILHHAQHFGEHFKVLGCVFDCQLNMHEAARVVATEAGWRLETLLRTSRFFTCKETVHLYKAQVLSFIESRTPGLYHAAPSVLLRIDRVQRRLLRELNVTELEALREHKLAPLVSRRDMGMPGALHKVTLGTAPEQLVVLLPRLGFLAEPLQRQRLRGWRPLHNRQLHTPCTFRSTNLMKRSLFGIVQCYNLLPQDVVNAGNVTLFQHRLQRGLLSYAEKQQDRGWERLFSVDWRALKRRALDELFAAS